jgi:hypothetical protein
MPNARAVLRYAVRVAKYEEKFCEAVQRYAAFMSAECEEEFEQEA